MKKEFIPLIGFNEKITLLHKLPRFIARLLPFRTYARWNRMRCTLYLKNVDVDVSQIKLIKK